MSFDLAGGQMKHVIRCVSGLVVAAWVMTSIMVAIAFGLCLGTAEAVTPHDHNTTAA